MQTNDDTPDDVKFIGIYYRCDDLYFAFPRYKLPENRPEAYDVPMHFVTASLLLESLNAISNWSLKYFTDEFQRKERFVASRLGEILGYNANDYPTFKELVTKLNKERNSSRKRQGRLHLEEEPVENLFGAEVLGQCCEQLMIHLSYLANRRIFFFIDDYSSPKITLQLQENLNRLFFQRSSTFFFKISTESPVSIAYKDLDGKIYTESREYNFVNIGTIFLRSEREKKETFFDDVFRRRFKQVRDYPVAELEDLIGLGDLDISENERARNIRASRSNPKPLWGKKSLCNLCSGDIHYAISVVKKMVADSGGTQHIGSINSFPTIKAKTQNQAIKDEAGRFLVNLKGVNNGAHLVNVVEAFGKVAASYLRFRNSKNEAGNPPWQASRIEPYELSALSDRAQDVYNELLRYSVFIQDFRGKSQRGNVVPRLYLRRFLIPHYILTFSNRDSVSLEHKELEQLLVAPQSFEKKMRIKSPEDAKRRDKHEEQRKMQINLPFKEK